MSLGRLMDKAKKKGVEIGVEHNRNIIAEKNGKRIDEQKPGKKESFDDAAEKLRKRMERDHVI